MLIPIGFFGAGGAAGSYELISSTVLTGSAATVSFSSIASTYKHLEIRVASRTDLAGSSDYIFMRFNSDTASNYTRHDIDGTGSAVEVDAGANQSSIRQSYTAGASLTANAFGASVTSVLDYASTSKFKTSRSLSGVTYASGTSGAIALMSGLWRSTSAVTSIELRPAFGTNFVAGSRFSLYGIKG